MALTKIRPCPHCGNEIPKGRKTYCSIECQLWSRTVIKEPDECWLWIGPTTQGYGVMKVGGRSGPVLRTPRLAWEFFNGRKIAKGMVACHFCDIRLCNNPHHIFEGTYKDNTQDMMSKGRHRTNPRKGIENSASKLSDEDIVAIMNDDRPQRTIAKEYGVKQTAIYSIKCGKTWKHLGVENSTNPRDKTRKAYHRSHLSPLTEEQVRAIKADPRPSREIAKDYPIAPQNICKIKAGKTWKHLD